jgi:hypothetical protein
MTSGDKVKLRKVKKTLCCLVVAYKNAQAQHLNFIANHYRLSIARVAVIYHRLVTPSPILGLRLPKLTRHHRTIDSLNDEDIPIYFRFRSKDQLRRLLVGFKFPDFVRLCNNHLFTGDEILLVSLYRFHRPVTCSDYIFRVFFGLNDVYVSLIFNYFLNYMENTWGSLLTDNMLYWLPSLPNFARAIQKKCGELGCPFPDPGTENGFRVFGFIDNTMNATCRPGGGPSRDGTNAPRNDPLIQRAFYNGWKKTHGFKWQTVDLPNGMNFNVWGPVSLRHNDLYTLHHSDINTKIYNLQAMNDKQYVIYGDSAYASLNYSHVKARHTYANITAREIAENKALSSCREIIEWDYGDVGKMWTAVDYKKALKLRAMNIKGMYFVALLLRNAYVTMNGCNTAEKFELIAPSFENWLKV